MALPSPVAIFAPQAPAQTLDGAEARYPWGGAMVDSFGHWCLSFVPPAIVPAPRAEAPAAGQPCLAATLCSCPAALGDAPAAGGPDTARVAGLTAAEAGVLVQFKALGVCACIQLARSPARHALQPQPRLCPHPPPRPLDLQVSACHGAPAVADTVRGGTPIVAAVGALAMG